MKTMFWVRFLATGTRKAAPEDHIGGSTYTLEVWTGHPLEDEALGELRAFRARVSALRSRVAAHNASAPMPDQRTRVVVYGGQCVVNYEENKNEELA